MAQFDKNKLQIRLYKTGDSKKIYELFTKYTPYIRDDKFWLWINRILCDKSIVAVGQYENEIIGHYAILPRNIIINKNSVKVGLGVHAFVSPEYREVVSIFQISNLAYIEAKRMGCIFIYGFPNVNYRLIQEKIERWHTISLFNALEFDINSLNFHNLDDNIAISEISKFDYSDLYMLNLLLESRIQINTIEFESSVSYWMCRYFMHPQRLYKVLKIIEDGQIRGFFICKLYEKNGIRYLHIIDYVYEWETPLNIVLLHVFSFFKDVATCISVWKGDSVMKNALKDIGFSNSGFDTCLCVKILDNNKFEELKNIVYEFDNWRLVMGDSDAF